MSCYYNIVIMTMLCAINVSYSMDLVLQKSEESLTSEYLALACVIDCVRPFSLLPPEIRNKIACYCLPPSPVVTTDHISNISGYIFTHVIKGNYLIGRSNSGMLVMVNLDTNKGVGPFHENIFFYGDFKDSYIKLCQRVSSASDGTIVLRNPQGYNYKFCIENAFFSGLSGRLSYCGQFTFGAEPMLHPSLPKIGCIKKYKDKHTISVYSIEVFDRYVRKNILPMWEKDIDLDRSLSESDYPLLWHPSQLNFLCKNRTCLKEYDANSGTFLRSFNVPDMSFDPYHIVYIMGGKSCAAVHGHHLYVLQGDAEPQLVEMPPDTLVDKILGVNERGHLLLLEMSAFDGRYVGMYDVNDGSVKNVLTIPSRYQRVLFDPVTTTIVVLEEHTDDASGDGDEVSKYYMRTQVSSLHSGRTTGNFSICHLMAYYAQNRAKTASDRAALLLPKYHKILEQSDVHLRKW